MAQNTDSGNRSSTGQPIKSFEFHLRDKMCNDLYLSDKFSDVKFLFPSKEEASETRPKKIIETIPAHKLILASISEVFSVMFNESWIEKNEVEIVDASAGAFEEFLQCFYLNSATFTKENIAQVMYLANKYQIADCMDACAKFLRDNLTPADVCWGYALAIFHEQSELRQHCEKKITANAKEVFASDQFLNCDQELLAEILKLDLQCKETIVSDGGLAWAKKACEKNNLDENNAENLRNQLGECVYLIQFKTMSMQEFTERTIKYRGFFKPDEFEDIIYCIANKNFRSEKFNQKPRLFWDQYKIWQCRPNDPNGSKYVQGLGTVHFMSNRTTLLGGIHCGRTYTSTVNALLSLNENPGQLDNERSLFSGKIQFNYNTSAYIKLPAPVVIQEGITYEIRFESSNETIQVRYMYCGQVTSPKGLQITFRNPSNMDYHFVAGLELIDL